MARYLLRIIGGVEPELVGPFMSEEARSNAARVLRRYDDEDGIFPLNCAETPDVWAYSGGFFDDADADAAAVCRHECSAAVAGCSHDADEDCMLCTCCGLCREDLDEADLCPDCGGKAED